ncbi:uncharacterized protein LOC128548070 [Mercenaria mercenaria]|uniref:uncharacterized protein LOC128548070 n=1 Tax=Mercenaria mercenaria TaxID=6596 RepID=UPI00234F4B6C|nr:uncharacterized protein LOC128548070 [Mercenaria mercenaria]
MSVMTENDFKQSVIIGTVVLGIFVAGYMIQVERKAAVADRKFSEWIERNHLAEFVQLFFQEDIGYLDGLVHFDIERVKSFKKVSKERKDRVKEAIEKLKEETVLKTWLHTKGLPEEYVDRLKLIGVEDLRQLSLLSDKRLQSLTEHDHTFEDYRDFMRGISQLKSYRNKLHDVEREMLIHHKAGIVLPGSYSLLTFFLIVLTTLLLIGVTFCIMLISRAQNVGSMFNLSSISKKSLYFLTGQADS